MTYEEARGVLVNITVQFGRSQGKTLFVEAWKTALRALDKQIPKKAKEIGLPFMVDNGTLAQALECGNCKTAFICPEGTKYCPLCGQAMDWGGAQYGHRTN